MKAIAVLALLGGAFGMGGVADRGDDIGLQHLFQGGAEGRHQFGRQVGDETDRVRQDHPRPAGSLTEQGPERLHREDQAIG